ncbi:MAG: hypothetical protein ACI9E5_000286 [Candidatus Omnitrophota bacterium]
MFLYFKKFSYCLVMFICVALAASEVWAQPLIDFVSSEDKKQAIVSFLDPEQLKGEENFLLVVYKNDVVVYEESIRDGNVSEEKIVFDLRARDVMRAELWGSSKLLEKRKLVPFSNPKKLKEGFIERQPSKFKSVLITDTPLLSEDSVLIKDEVIEGEVSKPTFGYKENHPRENEDRYGYKENDLKSESESYGYKKFGYESEDGVYGRESDDEVYGRVEYDD